MWRRDVKQSNTVETKVRSIPHSMTVTFRVYNYNIIVIKGWACQFTDANHCCHIGLHMIWHDLLIPPYLIRNSRRSLLIWFNPLDSWLKCQITFSLICIISSCRTFIRLWRVDVDMRSLRCRDTSRWKHRSFLIDQWSWWDNMYRWDKLQAGLFISIRHDNIEQLHSTKT